MSMPEKVKVTCPQCKGMFDTTIWSSVNTDLVPDLPVKIISGEFFNATCPSCGFVCHLEYNVLYHDMRHRAMIWVVPEGEDYDERLEEIRKTTIIPGYRTRAVHNTSELQEKVAIMEAGRDDRIVELVKTMLYSQAAKEVPNLRLKGAKYICVDGKEYINFYDDSGAATTLFFEKQVYQKAVWQFEDFLNSEPRKPYQVIDYHWALDVFERYRRVLEKEAEAQSLTVEQLAARRVLEKEKNEQQKRKKQETTQKRAPQMKTNADQPSNKTMPPTQGTEKAKMKCSSCGNLLPNDSEFCQYCGAKVVIPTTAQHYFCRYCGKPIEVDAIKSSSCGTATPRKRSLGTIVLSVLCVLLIGLNVLQYYNGLAIEEKLQKANITIAEQEELLQTRADVIDEQAKKIIDLLGNNYSVPWQ